MSNERSIDDGESDSSKWIRNPDGEIRRIGCLLVGVVVVVLFIFGQADLLLEVPFHLLAGWYRFLSHWNESGQIVWPDVELAGVFLVCLTIGIHQFACWLTGDRNQRTTNVAATGPARELAKNAEHQDDPGYSGLPEWSWLLTFKLTTAVLVLFLAGTAMLGMAHQTLWLASSHGTLLDNTNHEFIGRSVTKARLRYIGEAFEKYHEAAASLDKSSNETDPATRPVQSWVTQLLPWLGPEAARLDKQVQRNVAWNALENHSVMQTAIPGLQGRYSGRLTTDDGFAACHFAGNMHVFLDGRILPLREFRDGTTSTLLIGETRFRHKAWGDPENLRNPAVGLNQTPNGFGSHCTGITSFLMADGSVQQLSDKISTEVLRALSTPGGGEPVLSDFSR